VSRNAKLKYRRNDLPWGRDVGTKSLSSELVFLDLMKIYCWRIGMEVGEEDESGDFVRRKFKVLLQAL